MDWTTVKENWPLSHYSTFHSVHGITWHVQQMGQGPDLVFVHGAGGATQSWRNLMPILAQHFRCTAMDIPGQGFSTLSPRGRADLETLSTAVQELITHLNITDFGFLTHSAGAPIALRIAEKDRSPRKIVAVNAALSKFEGMAGWLFPVAAKLLAAIPFTAPIFAKTGGNRDNVIRLLKGTGSNYDAETLRLYQMLASDPDHVAGTLRMMADWNLDGLITRLPKNPAQAHYLVGDKDTTVPPAVSARAAARMPSATLDHFPDLGHLAHEEAAETIASAVKRYLL